MRKKVILSLALFAATGAASAQDFANGYYRFQSAVTDRYIVVVDNRGSVDIMSTTADLGAVQTFRGFDENIVSNPGSIIYVEKHGNGYDLRAQGVSTYDLVGYYLRIRRSRTNDNAYWAYATSSGMTSYINDEVWDGDTGFVGTNDSNGRDWYIQPVETQGENYFGVRPTCNAEGLYYQPFYASFPFSFASEGMKAYYVSQFGNGMAVLKEYTGEVMPASMPLIIECSSDQPANNRLDLLTDGGVAPDDNALVGVYFNTSEPSRHINRIPNDPAAMRMLGLTSEGELGMVSKSVSEVEYTPANTAYLVVPEGTASELRFVSEDEFTAGINDITVAEPVSAAKSGVYTLTGVKVADGNTLPDGLPAGVYIVGGKKVVVR